MNKKILWFFFSLFFVVSLLLLWQRILIDNDKKYAFSFDYHSLYMLNKYSGHDESNLKDYLLSLKKENVNIITLSNNNLFSLQERGFVSVKPGDDLRFATKNNKFKGNFTYISLFDNKSEIEGIINKRFSFFEKEIIEHENIEYIGINLNYNKTLYSAIPFLESDVFFLSELGFNIILKIDNKFDNQIDLIINQINGFEKKFSSTHFSIEFTEHGYLSFGYEEEIELKKLPDTFYAFREYFSDSEKQKGMQKLSSEKSFYRMHYLNNLVLTNNFKKLDTIEDRIVLAVTERNINVISLQLPLNLDNISSNSIFGEILIPIKESYLKLSELGYVISEDFNFEGKLIYSDEIIKLLQILSFLSVFTFLLIFLKGIIKTNLFFDSLFLIFSLMVSVFSDLYISSVLLKISILTYAVIIPILVYSLLINKLKKINKESIKSTISIYLFVNFTVITLALLIPSLHFGELYFDYVLKFSGITIATTLPIFLSILLVLFFYKKINFVSLFLFFKNPILIYQVIIALLLGVLLLFYVSRTGNSGSLLPFETQFRNLMTDLFEVRPRTKEFLIAQPLLFVCIYYFKRFDFLRFLLPLAIIGQISIVNTFSHIHTDVLINLYRSLLGVGLGMLFGVLLLLFIKLLFFIWNKVFFNHKQKNNL